MLKAGPWTMTADGCGAYRSTNAGSDDVSHRVAFIEKTPRVRIRESSLGEEKHWDENGVSVTTTRRWPDWLDWACGNKGSGPEDSESRNWCDRMLVALGYELENPN